MSLSIISNLILRKPAMSSLLIARNTLFFGPRVRLTILDVSKLQVRNVSLSPLCLQVNSELEVEARGEEGKEGGENDNSKSKVDPSKDRTRKIPVEVSVRYMESQAYKETYGDEPVWKSYRRNHKFQFPPRKTRKTCIRKDVISTGSPCPICRDEYLVLDYRNIKLLKQFISPYTDDVIGAFTTGVCRKKQFELEVAIEKAKDYGYIDFYVPKRVYSYGDYYPQWNDSNCRPSDQ